MTFAEALHSQFSLQQFIDFFLRIVVAGICGGVIGYERSKRYKEAGIRTHIIVCFASALIMIVSKYGFLDITQSISGITINGGNVDGARLAAQVISGISFLGAGVIIFKNGNTVRGLTTAAGLWATAGIGLAIGAGMYIIGIFSTCVMAVLQLLMHKFVIGTDYLSKNQQLKFTLKYVDNLNEYFEQYIKDKNIQVLSKEVVYDNQGTVSFNISVRSNVFLDIEDIIDHLSKVTEIVNVSSVSNNF